MGQLEDLKAFVQIVELESIGKAAEQSGIAKSAMSRKLRLLEERLQTTLIVRTTRQWSLTEAGRQYYENGLRLLEAYEEFEAEVRSDDREISGEIRISVPLYFGQLALTEPLLDFAQRHRDVNLNIDYNDRVVDMMTERLDLVVRITTFKDSSLIVRRLCTTAHQVCASPAYLEKYAPISSPEDLKGHQILQYGHAKRPKWKFSSGQQPSKTNVKADANTNGKTRSREINVSLMTRLNSHDGGVLVAAAERGLGVCRVPDFLARESLKAGRLIEVLPDYKLAPEGVYIAYPGSRYLPQRTRKLVDFLIESLS